jgi:hypothetical protein
LAARAGRQRVEVQAAQDRAAQLAKKLPNDKSLANSQELLQALPRSCVAPVDPPDAQQARADLERKAKAQQQKKK